MELLFYFRAARKGWWLIILCTVLSTAGAALATSNATPVYKSDVTFFVSGQQPTSDLNTALTGNSLSLQRVKSYADLVTSRPTVAAALLKTGDANAKPNVTAEAIPDTVIFVVTVKDSDPTRAMRIANGFGDVVPQIIDQYERPPGGGATPIRASVSQPAVLGKKVSPKVPLNLGLGLILGLLIGGGFALLREQLDNSVKSPEDLERVASHLSLMGTVFFDSDSTKNPLVTSTDPRAPRAEAYRQLRTNVQFAEIDSELRSFVVTSALPGEGKSTVSANLAIALAQAGQKVILVEADLRRPSLGEYMGFERAVGLTNVLIGQIALLDALQAFGADERLAILPGGPIPPNPSEILGSQAMNDLIRQLEDLADVVIFDTPPLLPVTDAAVLAAQTRGALLVIRAGKTTREQVRRALRALDAVGATAIGATLNFVKARDLSGYQYGYTESGYGPRLSPTDLQYMANQTPDVVPLRRVRRSGLARATFGQEGTVRDGKVPSRQPPTWSAGARQTPGIDSPGSGRS